MSKEKTLKTQYIALQAIYCTSGITILNYASNMLLHKGYSNTQIGIILSMASLFSILLQPVIADFADKTKKFNVAQIMLVIILVCLGLALPLYLINKAGLIITVVFVTISCLYSAMQPLVNVLDSTIDKLGIDNDYGFARSFGSLSFALFNAVMGNIVAKYTSASIALITLASFTLLFVNVLGINSTLKHFSKIETKEEKVVNEISMKEFMINNKKFLLLFLAVALFNFSNIVMDYNLIQIISPLGGTPVDQGYLAFMWAMLEVPVMMSFSKLAKKFSLESLLTFSAVIYSLRAVGMYFANNMLWIYISLSLQWGSFALFQPAIVEYINVHTKDNEKARGQALNTMISSIGSMIISFASGFVIDSFGIKTLLGVGAIVSIFGTIAFALLINKKTK